MNNNELRNKYNPEGSLLRHHQMRMLDILIEIDRICKKYDIKYWLSSGTLLGAIRHNGFIPWDDDLDIEMFREDYLRLIELLPKELSSKYAVQNSETEPFYFYFYTKIRDKKSILLEKDPDYGKRWKERGIYIDILFIEKHPVWMHKLTLKTAGHMYKIWRTSKNEEKDIKAVRHIYDLNRYILYPLLRFLCKLFKTKTYTWGMGIPFYSTRDMGELLPLTTHEFEGLNFPVPHNSDGYLRRMYGDYMRLPNLDDLGGHVKKLEFIE